MQRITMIAIAAALTAAPALARQVHTGDVVLAVQSGRIVTGSGLVSQGSFTEQRVIGVTLGAQGVPAFSSNPGYDCEPGTFPGGSAIGFNIRDRLWRWSVATFVPTSGEVMQLSSGPASRVSGEGFVAGFTLSVSANGQWHKHLGMLLQQGSAPSITDGAYLLELELFHNAGVATSRPYYLLFNQNASAGAMSAGESFVRARILPPVQPGDTNGDGRVDFVDLNSVLSGFGVSGQWLPGDVNRDGVVSFLDLNIVLGAFGAGV